MQIERDEGLVEVAACDSRFENTGADDLWSEGCSVGKTAEWRHCFVFCLRQRFYCEALSITGDLLTRKLCALYRQAVFAEDAQLDRSHKSIKQQNMISEATFRTRHY